MKLISKLMPLLLLAACSVQKLPPPQLRQLPPVPEQLTNDTGDLQTIDPTNN